MHHGRVIVVKKRNKMKDNSCKPKLLIIGAGWRVKRFILPAATMLGIKDDAITILRQSPIDVSNIRTITKLKDLDKNYDLIINCAAAKSMLNLQITICQMYPNATHLIDTPIIYKIFDIFRAKQLLKYKNIYSLEDWPFMPNTLLLYKTVSPTDRLSINHFGIGNHFLSFVRSQIQPKVNFLKFSKRHKTITAGRKYCHKLEKNYNKASIHLKKTDGDIIDSFSFNPVGPQKNEVYRTYECGSLRYKLNSQNPLVYDVPPNLMDTFTQKPHKKNIHELDKTIAVYRILKNALGGEFQNLYSIRNTLGDIVSFRLVQKTKYFPFL